jgi:phage-related protein
MRDIENIDFYDFYFNGKYLSDLGGYVADNDGGKITYSILPEREYVTVRGYQSDSEYVFAKRVNARQFQVPVFFEDLDFAGIRRVSGWLDTRTASQFYFKGDSIYINAMINSDAIGVQTYSGIEGLITLSFVAHDPYYYDLYSDTKYI